MADDGLSIELVAADRTVWSGSGTEVIARTVDGEIGVLRGHAPVLSVLSPSEVEIRSSDGDVNAVVDGGFISVAGDRVSILAERAMLAEDVDAQAAREDLEEAQSLPEDDEHRERRIERAEVWVRVAERAS